MKDKRSLHLKVQELCDCYATSDPLREMSLVGKEADKQEGALKWLALVVLHGINNNAKEVTLSKDQAGAYKVVGKYRKTELPSPGAEVGASVAEAVKGVAHIEENKGKMPLAVGIRDSSIEVEIEVVKEDGEEYVTVRFPKTR